jgi:hypothetical protein
LELKSSEVLKKKASIGLMLAFFSACTTLESETEYATPQIQSIEFDCDSDSDTWTARVFADAWTSDGELIMATSDRIEIHRIDSIRAAPQGSGDELLAILSIAADPDNANSGSSTGFLCTNAIKTQLSMRIGIFDFESEEESDCWQWGPEKDFSPWGYSPCEEVALNTEAKRSAN